MNDTSITVALIALGGALAVPILNGMGSFFAIRRERIKNRRRTLFYLLELRNKLRIKLVSPQYFIEHLKTILIEVEREHRNLPKDTKVIVPQEILDTLEPLYRSILESTFTPVGERFVEEYYANLDRLSETDPILAFRLYGSEEFIDIIDSYKDSMEDYMESLVQNVEGADIYQSVIDKRKEDQNTETIHETLDELDNIILPLSFQCGFSSWLSARKILKTRMPDLSDQLKKIKRLVQKMIVECENIEEEHKQKTKRESDEKTPEETVA
ncbi:hypothetical protein TUMSATVNIG1_16550 [Vibrio nigripulchritudo]|uniref:hypothetical protein n=1 Tax=Vibrio nigripulchritudo TaxID=28173 RepID=UPI0019092AC4|nr:hypothetical protein [Vibrio nigripulchritudo]BCL69699.1 hypothetical protein VNTUMSATTG_16360 [Vibrio nigripulchritudo]BDU31046.1 hypothetical protein TUMSATVNIG1_16550 [Vibrio nigripulchritudo]